MSTLKVGTVADTSGGSGSTPAQILNGRTKAWGEFHGVNDTINASYGVSSITDTGTGDYDVNFSTAMADAHYVAYGSVIGSPSGGYHSTLTSDGSSKEAGKCPFRTRHINDNSNELTSVQIAFIR